MRRITFISILLCWFVHVSFSQDCSYYLRNYTAVDGLPQSQIKGLIEDKNGYLWMGTQGGGLARFDGSEFKVYTTLNGLLSNDISGIILDNHDKLWTQHAKGVTSFDGKYFKTFTPSNVPGFESFTRMWQYQDTIFLFSMSGMMSKIYQDSVYYWERPIEDNKKIERCFVINAGDVCLVMDDGSFVIQTNKSRLKISPGVALGKVFDVFNWNGQVMVRCESGMFSLNIKDRQLQKLQQDINVENKILLYDKSKNIYWTSIGDNLIKESPNDLVKPDTVLPDIPVENVLIDTEGNTWFASNGHGLYKYFIQDFQHSVKLPGVMTIVKSPEVIWLGTMTKGLVKIENGRTTFYQDKKNIYKNVHVIKQAPNGTLWVGAMAGLGKYNKANDSFEWLTSGDSISVSGVRAIDFDEAGGMWVGSNNGISYYKEGWSKHYNTSDGLSSNFSWSLLYHKASKTLFVGNEIGLQTITNNGVVSAPIKGFANVSVLSLSTYQDSLIVAGTTGAGLILYNPTTNKKRCISTHHGLASNFIYFVAPDEKDYIWVGTEKGINRIKLDTDLNITENIHYGYDNGLTGVETNQNAYHFSAQGKYFGLVDGLYKFNDLVSNEQKTFNLHLTNVEVLYGEYDASKYAKHVEGFFNIPQQLCLPPDKNHVTFHFNSINKRYPNAVTFKYFLENFDKAWSLPSSAKKVTYGNLPPGNYTFRVMATNSKGNWSDNTITYSFTILAPFYKQAGFIITTVITTICLISLLLYVRVKQRIRRAVQLEQIRTQEQESLRKEIARDFHDEMGNQLTRIINYVSQLKLKGSNDTNHIALYNKVEESAKYLYTGTRDFIWSIDPVNDELSMLFIHIRDFGDKLFEEKEINFRAFNEIKDKVKLPYGFSREVNLIFKEAMTNVFKCSQAKNVTLSLNKSEFIYQLILEDDGIGFNLKDMESRSSGLRNIKARADKAKSTLQIDSTIGNGTKIIFTFNFNNTTKYGITI